MNPRGLAATATALLMVAILVSSTSVQAVAKGYWDTSVGLPKAREPALASYNGQLISIFQERTNLYDAGGNQTGRRGDIYFAAFNGTNWTNPLCLTPVNNDTGGHGAHSPRATEYNGKLYLTFESVEPSLKDDYDGQYDYDILMRVWDGTSWTPPLDRPAQVISERNDANVTDYECRSIVFRGTLYFMWSQIPFEAAQLNGSGTEFRRIVYRTFDGSSWGPISVAAQDGQSIYGMSAPAVFRDRLWICFHTNTSESLDIDIMACSFDGSSWTTPQRVNPAVPGSPVKRQNMNPRMEAYGDRLFVVWQSLDTIAKSSSNYDIMISSWDGSSWSYAVQVNRLNDEGLDVTPDVKSYGGLLYVAWSSSDPATTDGQQDEDIVIRTYDGRNWSPVELVSPFSDNGTISGEHNPGEDSWPYLLALNDRLYCTWITYDVNTGHKGGSPSVVVKQVRPVPSNGGAVPPVEGGGTDGTGPTVSWIPVAVASAFFVAAVAVGLAFGLRKRGKAERKEKGRKADGKENAGSG
jgi:hypothetical protein